MEECAWRIRAVAEAIIPCTATLASRGDNSTDRLSWDTITDMRAQRIERVTQINLNAPLNHDSISPSMSARPPCAVPKLVLVRAAPNTALSLFEVAGRSHPEMIDQLVSVCALQGRHCGQRVAPVPTVTLTSIIESRMPYATAGATSEHPRGPAVKYSVQGKQRRLPVPVCEQHAPTLHTILSPAPACPMNHVGH